MTDDAVKRADALLVVRCQLGEAAAFDALARRWARPLSRYVGGWTRDGDETNDLTQDIWLKVLRGLPRLRDPSTFQAWLFGIAHHAAMDRFRRRYRTPEIAALDDPDQFAATDEREALADREGVLAALERAMDRLPLVERQTLTLFYLEELPINEIARIAGVPTGTVKSRLFRGRDRLRAAMQEQTR